MSTERVEAVQRARASRGLLERDKHLMAWLARARCLSTEQIQRLMLPGREVRTARVWLTPLAGIGSRGVRFPLIRKEPFRTAGGDIEQAWRLTSEGYSVANELLGEERVGAGEVGDEFLQHLLGLNGFLVALVADDTAKTSPGVRPGMGAALDFTRAVALPFNWVSTESSRLPWREYDMASGRNRARLIVPDATLELKAARRRVFIEFETGTQTVVPQGTEKSGSTLAKAERYESYLLGRTSIEKGATHYREQFPDGFTPELLFLVPRPHRKDTINAALEKWQTGRGGTALRMRALTVSEAAAEFRPFTAKRRALAAAPSPAVANQGEVLAPGDLRLLGEFFVKTTQNLKAARHAVRDLPEGERTRLGLREAEYPPETVRVMELLQRLHVIPQDR